MHEYQRRILLAQAALVALGGGFTSVNVEHDNNCPLLVSGLTCDCDPFITVENKGQRYRITSQGLLEQIQAS